MTPDRQARLQAIADAHDELEAAYLDLAVFDQAKSEADGGDYNLHYLDVDPPPGAEEEFQALAASD